HLGQRRHEALPAKRQDHHDAHRPRPRRRRQPDPADRHEGRGNVALCCRQLAADLRPAPGRRGEAYEEVAGYGCVVGQVARPRGPTMPSRPVQALLAVEPGVDAEDVKDSLPGSEDFTVVGVVTGAEEALTWLRGGIADLLLVACAGYSDRALLLLDAVARQAPDLNVMVLGHGSPNGFLRRAFEAGADDIVMLPATPEQIRFEIHKLMARKQGAEAPLVNENSRLVCILGPKGGTGKTLTSTNLAVCLAQK